VHSCLEVTPVRDLDGHGRAFGNLERRTGDRSAVGEHSNIGVADSLDDRPDTELGRIAVCEFDDARRDRTRKSARVGGNVAVAVDCSLRLLVHEVTLLEVL
jgi:hypothetical protein